MKKWFNYILVVLTIILLNATACNQKDAKEQESKEDVPTIRIACTGFHKMPDDDDLGLINQRLGELSIEKAGIRIEIVPFKRGGNNAYMMLNDDQKPIDILPLYRGSNQMMQNDLLALDDLIVKYGSNIKNIVGEKSLELGRYHGKIYGVPKPLQDINSTGAIMLTEYVKKYNIKTDNIKSMADLEPILEMIKKKEPELIPYVPISPGREAITREVIGDVLSQNVAMVYYDDQTLQVVNFFETPEYEARIKMVRNWYLKGYLGEEILTNTESGVEQVAAGTAFSAEEVIRPDEVQFKMNQYGDKITFVNFNERPYLSTKSDTTLYWCVSNKCKDSEAAMKALDLLYSDVDIINTILYGVEGVNYEEKDSGHIGFPKEVTYNTTGYYNESKWMYNRNIGKVWNGVSLSIYDDMKKYNASAIVSPAYGFQYDDEKITMDVSGIQAVITEYAVKLGCGMLDVDKVLPEFQNKLRQAGANELVLQIQKQLDEWKNK